MAPRPPTGGCQRLKGAASLSSRAPTAGSQYLRAGWWWVGRDPYLLPPVKTSLEGWSQFLRAKLTVLQGSTSLTAIDLLPRAYLDDSSALHFLISFLGKLLSDAIYKVLTLTPLRIIPSASAMGIYFITDDFAFSRLPPRSPRWPAQSDLIDHFLLRNPCWLGYLLEALCAACCSTSLHFCPLSQDLMQLSMKTRNREKL